jgi:cytochrome c-type biogenesis protein CcmH
VLAAVTHPLWRAGSSGVAPIAPDAAVYQDQLQEVEADLARGLIDPAEAESARREIARRLIAAAEPVAATSAIHRATGRAASAVAILVPLLAIGLYQHLGSPGLPARPHAALSTDRAALQSASAEELIARVETQLARTPQDGRGWDVIAPVYFRQQRFAEAADAYERAGRLLGQSVPRLAGFAEATVLAANGVVTEPARLAYEKILALEPGRIEPRFWLALAKEQDGRHAAAAADYKAMLAAAPADAPWRPLVIERLAVVEPQAAADAGQPAAKQRQSRGPTAEDAAAADKLSPQDRAGMIAGMVESLAERLKTDTQNADGWMRLVQSYVVLGETGRARAALADARRHLSGNAAALAELARLARSLGLGS